MTQTLRYWFRLSLILCVLLPASAYAEPFRMLSYNVWYGFTRVPERKAKWVSWVQEQKPDVVSLQELNGYDENKLKSDAEKWGHDTSLS